MREQLTSKEAVELHQELEVHIVALGRLAVRALDVVAVEINTYSERKAWSAFMFEHALRDVPLSLLKENDLSPLRRGQENHSHTGSS